MQLRTLIDQLNNNNPDTRLETARIIGMLDEIKLIDPLAQAYKREPDGSVKVIMYWAGKRLQQAQAAGYDTFAEIWRYFQIDRDMPQSAADEEYMRNAEELKNLQNQLSDQGMFKAVARSTNTAFGIVAGGLDPVAGIASLVASEVQLHNHIANTSSTPSSREKPEPKRVKAQMPTDTVIAAQVKRLLGHPDAEQRRKAAATLADANNLAALSPLAQAFKDDPDETVRAAAQTAGKRIYWNSIYWTLENNGFIEKEIKRRTGEFVQVQVQEQAVKAQAQEISPDEKAAKEAKEREALDAILKNKMQKMAEQRKKR